MLSSLSVIITEAAKNNCNSLERKTKMGSSRRSSADGICASVPPDHAVHQPPLEDGGGESHATAPQVEEQQQGSGMQKVVRQPGPTAAQEPSGRKKSLMQQFLFKRPAAPSVCEGAATETLADQLGLLTEESGYSREEALLGLFSVLSSRQSGTLVGRGGNSSGNTHSTITLSAAAKQWLEERDEQAKTGAETTTPSCSDKVVTYDQVSARVKLINLEHLDVGMQHDSEVDHSDADPSSGLRPVNKQPEHGVIVDFDEESGRFVVDVSCEDLDVQIDPIRFLRAESLQLVLNPAASSGGGGASTGAYSVLGNKSRAATSQLILPTGAAGKMKEKFLNTIQQKFSSSRRPSKQNIDGVAEDGNAVAVNIPAIASAATGAEADKNKHEESEQKDVTTASTSCSSSKTTTPTGGTTGGRVAAKVAASFNPASRLFGRGTATAGTSASKPASSQQHRKKAELGVPAVAATGSTGSASSFTSLVKSKIFQATSSTTSGTAAHQQKNKNKTSKNWTNWGGGRLGEGPVQPEELESVSPSSTVVLATAKSADSSYHDFDKDSDLHSNGNNSRRLSTRSELLDVAEGVNAGAEEEEPEADQGAPGGRSTRSGEKTKKIKPMSSASSSTTASKSESLAARAAENNVDSGRDSSEESAARASSNRKGPVEPATVPSSRISSTSSASSVMEHFLEKEFQRMEKMKEQLDTREQLITLREDQVSMKERELNAKELELYDLQKQQQKKLALQHAEALRMLEETSTAKTEKEDLCGDEKENSDQTTASTSKSNKSGTAGGALIFSKSLDNGDSRKNSPQAEDAIAGGGLMEAGSFEGSELLLETTYLLYKCYIYFSLGKGGKAGAAEARPRGGPPDPKISEKQWEKSRTGASRIAGEEDAAEEKPEFVVEESFFCENSGKEEWKVAGAWFAKQADETWAVVRGG
ncbi:unnamed protein product [Amoebophrya sp. A120]|nr:unnamed protein product [Amoebophrya sp. A120]|eukprot:GSA120T00004705001.1